MQGRFTGLFNNMKTARKLFRLFKTLNEIKKTTDLLSKGDLDHIAILNVLQRITFGLYWIFDNISVLSSIKFLKYDAKQNAKNGAFFWFLALLLGQIVAILKLADLADQEAQLSKKERNDETKKQLKVIQAKKFTEYLNVIKQLGDMITSSSAIELPDKFGFKFSEGHIGIGGFVSAVITMYQLYP